MLTVKYQVIFMQFAQRLMWGKGKEIGVLCVAFDALYNRYLYTENLL